MELKDLVLGKKYKINKPEDIEKLPAWNVKMDKLDQKEYTLGKDMSQYKECRWLEVDGWDICPTWLTEVCDDVPEKEFNTQLPEVNVETPMPEVKQPKDGWTDVHYDFMYKHPVTRGDSDVGYVEIKVDPYFVNRVWKLNEKDDTGVLFHNLKTCARFATKNTVEREIKAMYAQIKRLAELNGVDL